MGAIRVAPVLEGRQMTDAGGGELAVLNPATGRDIGRQICCSTEDVDRLVSSAGRAFRSPGWRKLAPADRGLLLLRLADAIEAEADRLIELELLDSGKPITQLREVELPFAAALLRYYAGAADKIDGAVKNTPGGLHLTLYEPCGVVGVITPWNYPLVNVVMQLAPALAAGNAVVVKPPEETPLTTVALGELAGKAGIPPGIVNVALGPGPGPGRDLVVHPEVKKIAFVGSTEVGREIQTLAAGQMKPVNLECGGKNAIVVFADADLERAAEAALFSVFTNCGQLCVSCSRCLVEDSIAGQLEQLLAAKLSKVKVGDPRREATHVGPMITRAQYEKALRYMQEAPGAGCTVLAGGGRLQMPGELAGGFWVKPTLLAGVTEQMKVAREEIFGPVLSIMRFADEAEATRIANGVRYGLSGSVWTGNVERAGRMVHALDTGIIWVNTMLTGYPQIPVPPHKMSGTGTELGMEGLLGFCKRKSAVINSDAAAPVGWNLG